jgi:hypothetical protein
VHIVQCPREEVITVKFQNRVYAVTMTEAGAYVPADLGQHMVSKGLVARDNMPDPPPQWIMNSDGSYGDLIPKYQRYVREVLPEKDLEPEPSTIRGRKAK